MIIPTEDMYKSIFLPSLSMKVLENIVAMILTMPKIIVQIFESMEEPASYIKNWLFNTFLLLTYLVQSRRPVPSTDQAIPSCFYFRILWILMEQHCFYFFCPLGFLQGLRSLKHWLLQKLSMKNFDQKFKFLIKK